MAGPIGRVTGAAVSLYNENSLSLANLNFDFALVKLEAPKEFQELGMTISPKRKEDAESGALHQTARKLGALFEKATPNTPALYRAYGTRVSEISKDPAVNPQKKEGIFAQQIGADSASIWAAATSGSGAIAVHLLGCMLARMFTGTEATSLWVELVAKRKEQVQGIRNEAMYADEHFAALSAAQQEISRADLGRWDNSARAWLQSGDQAKILQHKQLMLILENLKLPVNEDEDVFNSIMKAWCSALKAMDSLVQGKAQRVQDGAVLLGMSSWHLYPDMTVLGDNVVSINQNDDLFQDTAILTIGLQFPGSSEESVSWSLPLACLQYYGHPVRAKRSVGQENARISMEQFEYVILGCVFANWADYGETLEAGLFWLQKLDDLLLEPTQLALAGRLNDRPTKNRLWLAKICAIGSRLSKIIAADSIDSRLAKQLVQLGRRRSGFIFTSTMPKMSHFEALNRSKLVSVPLFGLSDISVILPMINTSDQRVELLREFSTYRALSNSGYIIRYWPANQSKSLWKYQFGFEYATVQPLHVEVSNKRTHDGEPKIDSRGGVSHVRWLAISVNDLGILRSFNWTDISNENKEYFGRHNLPQAFQCVEDSCSGNLQNSKKRYCGNFRHSTLWKRQTYIRSLGEFCLPIIENRFDLCEQLISSGMLDFEKTFDLLKSEMEVLHLKFSSNLLKTNAEVLVGKADCAEIWIIGKPEKPLLLSAVIEPRIMAKKLNRTILDSQRVFSILYEESMNSLPERQALSAFAAASEIYSYLPHATISTTILSTPLIDAEWIPKDHLGNFELCIIHLSLADVFACVAMFDSGGINVDPALLSEVFAMSSGNSIFVTSVLLEDPAAVPNMADIRRIVGNIGQSGISFLVPPPEPKTRGVEMENWMQINHCKFDGRAENNFQHTTIHLSFTNYEMPLKIQRRDRHTIDRPARLVETLLAVHDRGRWIADLNFLEKLAYNSTSKVEVDISKVINQPRTSMKDDLILVPNIRRLRCNHKYSQESSQCTFQETLEKRGTSPQIRSLLLLRSIDNWDELLDPPQDGILVLRAHKNWLARLALAGVCINEHILVIILPEKPCWPCCVDLVLGDIISPNSQPWSRIALLY